MKRTYVVLSVLILLFLLWQIGKDYNRPYLSYQKAYKRLLAKAGEGEPELAAFPFGARQSWITGLSRVDRCETCHLGVEDPRFRNAPGPVPEPPGCGHPPRREFRLHRLPRRTGARHLP